MKKLLLGLLLLVAGCTNPLWWSDPNRSFVYRNWDVHVRDQGTVISMCAGIPFALGCTYPGYGIAWSVDNAYIMSHECGHIDAYTDQVEAIYNSGGDPKQVAYNEQMKDLLLSLSGINDLAVAATYFSSAGDCGSDVGKTGYATREKVIEQRENFEAYIKGDASADRDGPIE